MGQSRTNTALGPSQLLVAAFASLIVSLPAAGCRDATRSACASAAPVRPVLARENDQGVVGGPRDDTAFEFEPETDASEQAVVIEGAVAIPDDVRARLAPYLDTRRTRLAGALPRQRSFLALTRMGNSLQVYSVDSPLGPLKRLTREREPIEQVSYFGAANTPALLYRVDLGGNERFQLMRMGLESPYRSLLSDGISRTGAFSIAPRGDLVAFTANSRSEADMDFYLTDGRSRDSTRLLLPRQGQWIAGSWSADGMRMLVREYRSTEHSELHILNVATGQLDPVAPSPFPAVNRDGRFSADGKMLYFASDRDGDFVQLYELDLETSALRALTRDIPWDVDGIALWSSLLAFTTNEDGVSVLRIFDTRTRSMRRVPGVPQGMISSLRFADGGKLLALTLSRPTEPDDIYTVELDTGKLERWTASHLAAPGRFLAPLLTRIPSFDGVEVPIYYYRPPGQGPFPVLLWVHGGPEEQFRPAFDPIIQYFAVERRIAVLAPNVRGSDGYGRHYRNLDNGTLRTDAVGDVGAILDWIATRPELDAGRVGIHGVSYGGYMVLAALVAYGDRLAAGCDVVGLSNLVSFLEGTSVYRRDTRRAEYGDERDPIVREFLQSISPLFGAARIRSPLLVAHGANDPRVPLAEAEQIVKAVRESGTEAWYMVAPDEGHGFRKRQTRDTFYQLMATFFEIHLLRSPRPAAGDGADPAFAAPSE